MNEQLKNYPIQRDANFRVLENKEFWEFKTKDDALTGWSELISKVVPMQEGEAKQFWMENLESIRKLLLRHDKVLFELKNLEQAYKQLYSLYDSAVTELKRLEEL